MKIRHTEASDLPAMRQIYARARKFMAETGNPIQWGDRWPPEDLLVEDIRIGRSYVCEEDGEVVGTFVYIYGKDVDPTYLVIHDGAWKDPSAYGAVHRLAGSGTVPGVGAFCLDWAMEQSHHLRVDTHGDNKVMQRLLKKLGFEYCGIIYVEEDDEPRLAYEKVE